MVTVGLRFQESGISRKLIRPVTGQTKLQTMQLRQASLSSFGRRFSASHDRALPQALHAFSHIRAVGHSTPQAPPRMLFS